MSYISPKRGCLNHARHDKSIKYGAGEQIHRISTDTHNSKISGLRNIKMKGILMQMHGHIDQPNTQVRGKTKQSGFGGAFYNFQVT
jgi:hypothetical protein